MGESGSDAPGWPGIAPRWTSSAKSGTGTSLSPASRVWFALGYGILNEIYFPDVDRACTRDVGLVVTDGAGFFSEEKRHATHELTLAEEGVPAFRLVNRCIEGRYVIEKEIITDPTQHAVLQWTRFTALAGALSDYHVHVLAAPHLGNRGTANTAWLGEHKGVPMLFAMRGAYALAVACSAPWRARSVGYAGVSDGWQDLQQHKRMTWEYTRAEDGNVALCAEVDLVPGQGEFVVALGFGTTPTEAAHHALAAVQRDFSSVLRLYVEQWRKWQATLLPLRAPLTAGRDLYRLSAAVLSTHEAQDYAGGIIASLSIPWGFSKGDDDLGGYHLVWPRDLVEVAGGLLAAGAAHDVREVLRYLRATQEADGRWPQNMWLDGTPYWKGVQMDETAFPILLADLARREGALDAGALADFWPMVRHAAQYLAQSGPVTQQDRWEEDGGYSPFTLAVEISALLAAADLADIAREPGVARYLRETADSWNACVERWVYVTGSELAKRVGVAGYYVRIASPTDADGGWPAGDQWAPARGRVRTGDPLPDEQLISADALALVRFGLRAPDDPRILDTIKVIDALLRTETPCGPSWRRYVGDQYGEHADGSAYDGTGIGRLWPLLTGERAHYELAAGNMGEAARLVRAVASFANDGGMIPEQVWDAADIPEHELRFGRPTGSAMPLAWAHAEYIKLLRSLRDGAVFDMPPQTVERYCRQRTGSALMSWRFNHKIRSIPVGTTLRVEVMAPATVRWTTDGWATARETPTRDTSLGVHVADLGTAALTDGAVVTFTFRWLEAGRWEGQNLDIRVGT